MDSYQFILFPNNRCYQNRPPERWLLELEKFLLIWGGMSAVHESEDSVSFFLASCNTSATSVDKVRWNFYSHLRNIFPTSNLATDPSRKLSSIFFFTSHYCRKHGIASNCISLRSVNRWHVPFLCLYNKIYQPLPCSFFSSPSNSI